MSDVLGKAGPAQLKCIDAQLNTHCYDASTLKFVSFEQRSQKKEKDSNSQWKDAPQFLGEADLPNRLQDKNLILLSPGNVAVNLDGLAVSTSLFPAGRGIVSPKDVDVANGRNSKLVDPHWEFYIPGIQVIDGISSIASDRVILGLADGKVAAWLIRIYDPKQSRVRFEPDSDHGPVLSNQTLLA